MRKSSFYKVILFFGIFSAAISASAWNHGISIGYGGGTDINHHDISNQGGLISGSFLSILEKKWLKLTFDGSLGYFTTTTSASNQDKDLFATALSLAFRFYPFQIASVHPYFLVSVGPGYISTRHFGPNSQGANFAFQSLLGIGTELGTGATKRIDVNLKLVHYSNAYLFKPNNGYNIMYVASVGYLFS